MIKPGEECQFRSKEKYLLEYSGENCSPVLWRNCLLDEWDTCIHVMEQFLLLISVGFLFIVIAGFHVYKQQMGHKRL